MVRVGMISGAGELVVATSPLGSLMIGMQKLLAGIDRLFSGIDKLGVGTLHAGIADIDRLQLPNGGGRF